MKRSDAWISWERDFREREPVDFPANLRLWDALWQEARALGALPPAEPLEGIDIKIRLARVLNARGPV